MRDPFIGEFVGTFILVLLGDGVVAGCVLKRTKAEGAGWMAITTGWGFAVFCGIFVANLFGSSDAHLNPAFTLAFAVKEMNFAKMLPYLSAQLGGAFAGAATVWLFYYPHWEVTEDKGAKLGAFCTAPAIRSYAANLFCEFVATAVLVTVAGAISSKLVLSKGAAAGLTPFLIGSLVWSIGLSLGATTGYAINPARDLGPRLAHALLPVSGKGGSDWKYAWIPVFGPLAGGALAGYLLRMIGA